MDRAAAVIKQNRTQLILWYGVNILDVILTYIIIMQGGYEGNFLLPKEIGGIAIWKMAASTLFAGAYVWILYKYKPLASSLRVATWAIGFVCLWNIAGIIAVNYRG